MKPIYIDPEIHLADIVGSLRGAGLKQGDTVMVHSDLSTFGRIGDMDREEFLSYILGAFKIVLGEFGTLIVPTYTYSFISTGRYDVKMRSEVGTFSNFVLGQPGAYRSIDPIFSHAGIGRRAKPLLEGMSYECFGIDSFFDLLYRDDGKIMNFGKFFDITFLHYVEKMWNVPYRYDKPFTGTISDNTGEWQRTVIYYVRALKEDGYDVRYDMRKLGRELDRRGMLGRAPLGNSEILCSRAQDCFHVGYEMLDKDVYAFLEQNPVIESRTKTSGDAKYNKKRFDEIDSF